MKDLLEQVARVNGRLQLRQGVVLCYAPEATSDVAESIGVQVNEHQRELRELIATFDLEEIRPIIAEFVGGPLDGYRRPCPHPTPWMTPTTGDKTNRYELADDGKYYFVDTTSK